MTRLKQNISEEDPIHSCKVSRLTVRAPEALARMAAQRQLNRVTNSLHDTEIRQCIKAHVKTFKQCLWEVMDVQSTSL
ncbi:hypothetical protein QJS04_geneDACA011338 [Acorus gramineus]|uniref:Uncharacterized protein n=1 Tax=Acorus gramineus TaxID=55184 RepID=A0AAV9ALR7_ACOGR|nr:hypothetical protein QJS04_geneDACA011338 [Acorus gramineus]